MKGKVNSRVNQKPSRLKKQKNLKRLKKLSRLKKLL